MRPVAYNDKLADFRCSSHKEAPEPFKFNMLLKAMRTSDYEWLAKFIRA